MTDGMGETGGTSDVGETGETNAPAGEPEDLAQPRPAPDDEFDRALRSLTEGTAPPASLREPSAAERTKAAAQAHRKQERARKRYAKLEKKDRKQEHREQKKDARARPPTLGRRSRRRGAAGAGAVVIVVLGGGAWFAGTHLDLASLTGAGGPNDTQVVTNGAVPAVPPTSSANASGPPADPFAGTPADNWADGASGIAVPQANRVGEYSTAQVKYAYETTKKLLDAAALDKQTLLGGTPTAFVNLLSRPNRTQFVSKLNRIGLDKKGAAISSRAEVVSFAPGTTKLIGSVIKVHGMMSARATTDNGARVLEVHVNYLVAYPVEPPRAPEDWTRVVAHFDGYVMFGDWSGAKTSFEPWWGFGPSTAGSRCSMPDGYVHPDFPSGPPDKVRPSGPAIDPYSLQQNNTAACERTTGT